LSNTFHGILLNLYLKEVMIIGGKAPFPLRFPLPKAVLRLGEGEPEALKKNLA
jgi:hypothetical protein